MNLTGQKPRQKLDKPKRDEKHRQFVASLPCISCGRPGPSQCAHVRLGWYRGGGRPGDDRTVPLCAPRLGTMGCHAQQHNMSEDEFWNALDINPLEVAAQLYAIFKGDLADKQGPARVLVLSGGTEGKVT